MSAATYGPELDLMERLKRSLRPQTGVFTTCVGGCNQGAEFDGLGGLVEPGWTFFVDPEGEWEEGWQCPDCRREFRVEQIKATPFTAWTFPA